MEYNYSQLLAFDCCTSVTYTKSQGARKLNAWNESFSTTNYPAKFNIESKKTGEVTTANYISKSGDYFIYSGGGYKIYIDAASKRATIIEEANAKAIASAAYLEGEFTLYSAFVLSGVTGTEATAINGNYSKAFPYQDEGNKSHIFQGGTTYSNVDKYQWFNPIDTQEGISFVDEDGTPTFTVNNTGYYRPAPWVVDVSSQNNSAANFSNATITPTTNSSTHRVKIYDPEVRSGDDIVRINYESIHRGAVTDELDAYLYSTLNVITDETIKGHELKGTWRLTNIIKQDSDSPDTVLLRLEYKRGYATTLDFTEAVLVNKEDYRTDTTKIIIQFNNIDPRFVEKAKDTYRSQETLSNPVFGGVEYSGFWHNIKMVTSETQMAERGADYSEACSVTWLLTQHNNTDVYFKFKETPLITKGFFYKWDATETTLNSLIANTYFTTTGDIDTNTPPSTSSKTLQQNMTGRTVLMRRTSRDEEDRLYDLEVELTYYASNTATSGNTNAFQSEEIVITDDATSELGEPNDQNNGVTVIHESQQKPNGLFRNIKRTITARTDVGTVSDESFDSAKNETIVKKYNQASAEDIDNSEKLAGKTIRVENTLNEDGTFNTVKRTITGTSKSVAETTENVFNSAVTTKKRNTTLNNLNTTSASQGTTVRDEREIQDDGLYSQVQTVTNSKNNVPTVTDERTSGNDDAAGFTEVITKKYNQTTPESVGDDLDAAGKTITVENTLNEDGTYNTVKSIREDRASTASSGTKGTLTSETVTITNNASQVLAQANTAEVGKTKINTSEQLENGLFRNVARVITSHANNGSTDVIDQTGSSEQIIKKYNQANPLSHNGNEEADGKTITVENTINPDGTYNTIKRTRTDTQLTATGGSNSAKQSEEVIITNNASSQLDEPGSVSAGTIKIHESEQLPNGLYRNVARTITAKSTFGGTITDEMSSGSDGNFHAYTETTVKKYNQDSALSYTDDDDAVGRIRKKESIPNEDGTFNTIETTRQYQGFSRFYNTKDKHYLIGYHLNPNSTDGFKYTGQASGTTFANLRSYAAGFKGTFDIVDNDDGTVSYKAVLSKTVENHTLTVRKGGKVTETIEYLRNTTDTAIDNKLSALSANNTAGTVVNVQRITGENGALDAILSKTATDSSSLSRSYDNGATDIDYEFGFGATSVPSDVNNLADGKTCVLQASQREDGLFDYVKTTTTVTNYSRQFSLRNQIILLGHHVSTTDNTGFKTPDYPNGTTFTNFKTYISSKDAQLELRENDDNTVNYIVRINSAVAEEYVTPLAGDNEISTRIIVKENQASFPDQKDIAESVEIDINGDFTNTSGTANRADTWSTPVEDTSTAGIYFTDAGTVRLRDTRTAGVNNTVDAYLKKNDSYLDAGREYRFTYTVTEFNDASGETSNLRFQYNESGLDNNVDDGVTGVTGFGSDYGNVDMNKEVGTHSFTFTAGGTGGVAFNIYYSNSSNTKNSYIVLKDLILEQLSHLNETNGTTFTTRSLRGPNGSGTPVINPDGTYSYAIVSETKTVSKIAGVKGNTDGTDFYLKSMGRRTERNAALRSSSFQQIERRIGGELEFNKDDQGNLSGVNWSASWDANTNTNNGSYPTSIPPDDWFSAGYQARYGAWKDRYVKTYLTGPGSLVAPTHPTSTCKGVYRADAIYQIGDVVYSTANSRFEIATGGQNAWSGSSNEYAIGQSVTSGNLIYTVTDTVNVNNVGNREVTPQSQIGISDLYVIGALGSTITWSAHDESNIIQKIGIAETGVSVFKDVDYYISILKEVSREVKWNEEWEWTSGTTYNNNDVVFYLPTQKRYKGKNTPAQNEPSSGGNTKWTELDDDATDAPKGWSTYAGQYGTWQGRFTKAYKVGPNSLANSNLTNTGFWTGTRVYKVGEVASFGTQATSRETPSFKILTTSNTSAYSPGSNYTAGDLVIQGGKLFKCIATHTNSDKDPVRESGIGIWQEGATGTELGGSGSNKWSSIGNTEVEAVIGLRGAGGEPFEAPAKVGVLDGSGGFAASPSSRLAFYTNAGLNPRLCEIYEANKRDELTIVLRTYFAVNPDYLAFNQRRIPEDYTTQNAIKDLITNHISTSTGTNKLRVPPEFSLNADHSNYEIVFDRGREGSFYIIDMQIVIRTPFVKDLEGLTDIKNRLSNNSHGKIVDDKVIVYRDLTHATKPWDTNLLSL